MTPQLQQAIKLLQMSNLELAEYLVGRGREEPAARARAAGGPRRLGRRGGDRRGERDGGYLDTHGGGGDAATSTCTPRSARCAAARERDRGGADPRRRARGRRLPAGAAGRGGGPAPADGRRGAARGWRSSRPAIPPGSARATCGSAWRCSSASGTGSTRRCRRCSTTWRWRRAGGSLELQAHCGVDAEDIADMLAELRALDPKPGLRFAAGAGRGRGARTCTSAARPTAAWTVELNSETLPRVLVNNVYAARDARRDAGDPRLHLGMQRQRQLAGAQPRAAGADDPQGGDRDRPAPGRASSRSGSRELRPLTQRAIAGTLGLHEFNRQPCRGRKIPRPAIRAASSSATSSARRSRRSPAARPSPRRRCRSASAASSQAERAGRTAFGRQNRRPPERRGD